MKYMFLTYLDEKAWANLGETEQQRVMETVRRTSTNSSRAASFWVVLPSILLPPQLRLVFVTASAWLRTGRLWRLASNSVATH